MANNLFRTLEEVAAWLDETGACDPADPVLYDEGTANLLGRVRQTLGYADIGSEWSSIPDTSKALAELADLARISGDAVRAIDGPTIRSEAARDFHTLEWHANAAAAEWRAQLATARTQAHAAGRLEGELAGLAQGLAVATGDGALWLRQRYRAVEAVVAVVPVEGAVTP